MKVLRALWVKRKLYVIGLALLVMAGAVAAGLLTSEQDIATLWQRTRHINALRNDYLAVNENAATLRVIAFDWRPQKTGNGQVLICIQLLPQADMTREEYFETVAGELIYILGAGSQHGDRVQMRFVEPALTEPRSGNIVYQMMAVFHFQSVEIAKQIEELKASEAATLDVLDFIVEHADESFDIMRMFGRTIWLDAPGLVWLDVPELDTG